MTVIKGGFGDTPGGGPGGGTTIDNIDLTHAKTIECEKSISSNVGGFPPP